MTREQRERAARVLEQINYVQCTGDPTIDEQRRAVDAAIDALRGPEWVRTADRLPTEADADDEGKVTALITGSVTGKLLSLSLYYKSVTANSADYFLPLPKLPEVEDDAE